MSKASGILIGFSIMALSVYPVFAEENGATTAASVRKPLIQQKIENKKEKIASRTAILRSKLQNFRDVKKAAAAERIDANLATINRNQTSQMQRHLSDMGRILDKLEGRVGQTAAITTARTTIASASAAVLAQSEKDYTITVTSEARIKVDAKKQRDALHADLLSVRKMVIEAKQSVANAIRIAKSGKLETEEKEGSDSGQQ